MVLSRNLNHRIRIVKFVMAKVTYKPNLMEGKINVNVLNEKGGKYVLSAKNSVFLWEFNLRSKIGREYIMPSGKYERKPGQCRKGWETREGNFTVKPNSEESPSNQKMGG